MVSIMLVSLINTKIFRNPLKNISQVKIQAVKTPYSKTCLERYTFIAVRKMNRKCTQYLINIHLNT